MLNRTGVDPYDWPLDMFCDAVTAWARGLVLPQKNGEHKWAELEASLWEGVERTPQDEQAEAAANAAALAKLGGPTSRR